MKLVTTSTCMATLSHDPALVAAKSKIIPEGFSVAVAWMLSIPMAPLMAQVESA